MMIRRQIYLTQKEIDDITGFAKELGISASEYIRRLLDDHIALCTHVKNKIGDHKSVPEYIRGIIDEHLESLQRDEVTGEVNSE